ncbi:drug:proton antiporter [Pseudomonas sp. 1D4]|uniref:VOC family protein n=1 Tax=unclassified Pseudomonas TaxID=196821 RepID=UPI00084B8356|nr:MULTISPECIES: VOC family protein [unclassified Pseudomonas]OEC40354.1 drug:proton antiporter [Pseudomonas sp. 1D4]OEC51592.1 drug:proton antiporter [Pseudomonas sp. ENNP23]
MIAPSLLNLYVDDSARSADFYRRLLTGDIVEQSSTFALFVFPNGFKLGLWGRTGVEPATTVRGGGGELCVHVDSDEDVDRLHQRWREQGVEIVQAPLAMDFGYTFTGLDPDGHRLRVYHLAM